MDWRKLKSPAESPVNSSPKSAEKSQPLSGGSPQSKQSSLKRQKVSPLKAHQNVHLQNPSFQSLLHTYRSKNNILSKYYTLQPLKNKQNVTQKQIVNDPVVFEEWDDKKSNNQQSDLRDTILTLKSQIDDVKNIISYKQKVKEQPPAPIQNQNITAMLNDLKKIKSTYFQNHDPSLENRIQAKIKQMRNTQNQLGNYFFERRLDQP